MKTVKLGHILTDIAMGPFGSNLKVESFQLTGVPVIRGQNLNEFYVSNEKLVYVSPEKAAELSRSIASPGEIVVTHRGTLGQVSMIPFCPRYLNYLVSQSQMRLQVDRGLADPRYVTYWMRSRIGQHTLLSFAVQTGVPAIARPTSSLRDYPIALPKLGKQHAIADLLGSLDDKIAANNDVISASNELIRNLYRALPASSRTLNDVAILAKNNEQPHRFLPDKRLIGLEHFEPKSLWLPRSSAPETATSAKTTFQAGDTLFGKLRPYFHKVAIAPFDGYCSTDILVLRAKNPLHSPLVATAANSDAVVQQAVNCSNGTRMPRAKWADIEGCPIPEPDAPATLEFIGFAATLIQDATARLEENKALAKTRDELLPLLMNGKITVREAEQEATAAGVEILGEENEA